MRASEAFENHEVEAELSDLSAAIEMYNKGTIDTESMEKIYSNFFVFPIEVQSQLYHFAVDMFNKSLHIENGEWVFLPFAFEILRLVVFHPKFINSPLDLHQSDCREGLILLFSKSPLRKYHDQALRVFTILTKKLGEFETKWIPAILEVTKRGDLDLMCLFSCLIEVDFALDPEFYGFMITCADDVLHMRKDKWEMWESLRFVDLLIEKGHDLNYSKLLEKLPEIVKDGDIRVMKMTLSVLWHLKHPNIDVLRFLMMRISEIPNFGDSDWDAPLLADFDLYILCPEIRSAISNIFPEIYSFLLPFLENPHYMIRSHVFVALLTLYDEPPFSVELLRAILNNIEMTVLEKRGLYVLIKWIESVSDSNFAILISNLTECRDQLYDFIAVNHQWSESVILEKYLDAIFKHAD